MDVAPGYLALQKSPLVVKFGRRSHLKKHFSVESLSANFEIAYDFFLPDSYFGLRVYLRAK